MIAAVCHSANKAYCESIGDYSQASWVDAEQWQRDSAAIGVKAHLENPDMTPEESHRIWFEYKLADGWKYGEEKDPENKLHPCMRAYDELPQSQRSKDFLFKGLVDALRKYNE